MSIKRLQPSDKISRPFKVFKNWNINTRNNDDVILLECGDPIAICYQSASVFPTGCLDVDNTFPSSSIALEQQSWLKRIRVEEGIKKTLKFYDVDSPLYDSDANPLNWTGTYKRSIFSLIDKNFYDSKTNTFNLFGIESIGYDENGSPLEKRNIGERINVGNITLDYGEKISPNTVKITDYSFEDEVYSIEDDGYTNLKLTGKFFKNRYELKSIQHSTQSVYDLTNDRFGYDVDSYGNYIAVGMPLDADSFTDAKTGRASLFKYDTSKDKHRFVKEFFSPETQNSLVHELSIDDDHLIQLEQGGFLVSGNEPCPFTSIKDGFGKAVAVSDKWFVVGAPYTTVCDDYCDSSGSGFVYIYDKYKGGADNWGLINVLEGGSDKDMFGTSVAVDGDTVVVGSPGVSGSGAVYVFRRKIFMSDDACVGVVTSSFYQVLSPEWDYETGQYTSSKCSNLINESQSFASLYDLYEEKETPYFIAGNNTFLLEQIITADDPMGVSGFGHSVDIYGNTIVVGTNNTSSNARVYTFEYNVDSAHPSGCISGSWVQNCILFRDTTHNFNDNLIVSFSDTPHFGDSVSIFDGFIAIGCPNDIEYKQYSGSSYDFKTGRVYIFKHSGELADGECDICIPTHDSGSNSCRWVNIQTIDGIVDTSQINYFGSDVSLSATRLLIGSPNIESVSASYSSSFDIEYLGVQRNQGKAYVYKLNDSRDEYQFEKEIVKTKKVNDNQQLFGNSVSLTEKFVVIGAPTHITVESGSENYFTSSVFMEDNFIDQVSGSVYTYDVRDLDNRFQVGNVFYKNGLITITDENPLFKNILNGMNDNGFQLDYQSTHTIFENEYLIRVNPGEFNVSQNPTAVVRHPIEFDINGDGVFDIQDVDIILRYINKFKILLDGVSVEDDNGIIREQDLFTNSVLNDRQSILRRIRSFQGEEAWWNNDIIMTESEDVLLLEQTDLDVLNLLVSRDNVINRIYLNRLVALDEAGKLDFNGDGSTDGFDANILWKYYIGQRGNSMVEGNIPLNSKRKFSFEIVNFIDSLVGAYNGTLIHPNFHNYIESSSYDRTGSYLSPYVTTIGLYDDKHNLVAVAKVGKPVKVLQNYPVNFLVKWDS